MKWSVGLGGGKRESGRLRRESGVHVLGVGMGVRLGGEIN